MPMSALVSEYLMHERNRDRAFPHCRRNALDVAASHITRRENSWEAGFEQVWPTSQRPVRSAQVFRRQVGTSLNEAFIVERDTTSEPVCVRNRPRHHKHMRNVLFFGFSGLIVSPGKTLEMIAAFESDDFCVR